MARNWGQISKPKKEINSCFLSGEFTTMSTFFNMSFLLIYSIDQKRVLVLFFAPISFMAFFWSSFPIKFLFLSCGIYWAKRRGSFFIQLRFSVLWYFKKHWPFSWIPKAIVGGLILSTLYIAFCRIYSDFILGRELFFTPPLKGCFQSKELTF